jgi:hypothetical protein
MPTYNHDDENADFMAAYAAGVPIRKNYDGILDLQRGLIHHQLFWSKDHYTSVLAPAASRRTLNCSSSYRRSKHADQTGLMGELAWFRVLGYTPKEALEDYRRGLGKGDGGIDATIGRVKLDVKATKQEELRFRSSKLNPHYHAANAWGFTYVDFQPEGVTVSLLGWAFRADLKGDKKNKYLHEAGPYEFCKLWPVSRDGLLRPVQELLDLREQDHE